MSEWAEEYPESSYEGLRSHIDDVIEQHISDHMMSVDSFNWSIEVDCESSEYSLYDMGDGV